MIYAVLSIDSSYDISVVGTAETRDEAGELRLISMRAALAYWHPAEWFGGLESPEEPLPLGFEWPTEWPEENLDAWALFSDEQIEWVYREWNKDWWPAYRVVEVPAPGPQLRRKTMDYQKTSVDNVPRRGWWLRKEIYDHAISDAQRLQEEEAIDLIADTMSMANSATNALRKRIANQELPLKVTRAGLHIYITRV